MKCLNARGASLEIRTTRLLQILSKNGNGCCLFPKRKLKSSNLIIRKKELKRGLQSFDKDLVCFAYIVVILHKKILLQSNFESICYSYVHFERRYE